MYFDCSEKHNNLDNCNLVFLLHSNNDFAGLRRTSRNILQKQTPQIDEQITENAGVNCRGALLLPFRNQVMFITAYHNIINQQYTLITLKCNG